MNQQELFQQFLAFMQQQNQPITTPTPPPPAAAGGSGTAATLQPQRGDTFQGRTGGQHSQGREELPSPTNKINPGGLNLQHRGSPDSRS